MATIASRGKVIRYRNDYTALVRTPTGLQVESSTAPLRVRSASGKKLPVSLELETKGGHIQPRRPLAPVFIGERADSGVSLIGSGISLTMLGGNSSAAAVEGKQAFYGEVAKDVDEVAMAKINGADLSALIRSADSPEELRYRVGLPLGAKLEANPGGALVERGTETLAKIPSPWAQDAQGTSVPTEMRVSGDELRLKVDHRQHSYAYPIFVDPELLETISNSPDGWEFIEETHLGYIGGWGGGDQLWHGPITHNNPGSGSPLSITIEPTAVPFEVDPEEYGGQKYFLGLGFAGWEYWKPDPFGPTIYSVTFEGISGSGATGPDLFSRIRFHACEQTLAWSATSVPAEVVFTPGPGRNCKVIREQTWSEWTPSLVWLELWSETSLEWEREEKKEGLRKPIPGPQVTAEATLSVGAIIVARAMTLEEEQELGVSNPERYGSSNPDQLSSTNCFRGDPVNCATGNLVEEQHDLPVGGLGPALSTARTYNSQLAAIQEGTGSFGSGWASAYETDIQTDWQCIENCAPGDDIAVAESEEEGAGEELGSGLLAAYSFDEGEGAEAADSAGGHDGEVVGAEWAPGKFGPALRFPGDSGARVTVPSSPELDLTEGFTVEAWVHPGRAGSYLPVVEKETPGYFGYELAVGEDGVPVGYISPEGYSEEHVPAVEPLPLHEWSNLALTFDGTDLRLYVNGELAGTKAINTPQGGSGALQIGGSELFGNSFAGKIDEVRIYDRALDAEEVQADEALPIGTTEGSEGPEEEPEEFEEPEEEPEVREERSVIHQYNGSTAEFRRIQGESAWLPVDPLNRAELVSEGEGFAYTLPDQTVQHLDSSGLITSEEDPNGNTVTVNRDSEGQVSSVTDDAGRELVYSYNSTGFVKSIEDPMGHVVHYGYEDGDLVTVSQVDSMEPKWQFEYDQDHELISVTDARGGVERTKYEAFRVVRQEDPMGRVTSWAYSSDEEGTTTTITEPNGSETVEQFNQDGLISSMTRAAGTPVAATTTYGYDPADELISVTNPEEQMTEFAYDNEGNKVGETDPGGHETIWTYNDAHQIMSETSPSGEVTTIARDADGNPETISRPAPGGKTQTSSFEYGPHGELESTTDPTGATWTFEYNGRGDRTAETDPEGDERTWTYDGDSRVVSTVSPRGNEGGAEPSEFETLIERDAQGRPVKVTDPLGGKTEYVYDAGGNIESVVGPNGHESRFTYDADNEQTKIERADGAIEETGYDEAAQVINQTDGNGAVTTYVRNPLEEPIETIDPLERSTTRAFDAAGRLEAQTDPEGRVTTFGYNQSGQLQEIDYSDGTTPDVDFGYDKDGQLTSMVDGTGESAYEYDQLGRLIHTTDGNGETVDWEYNLDNEPIGMTYPNGKSIVRTYDKAGRLESVTDWLGDTSSFSYNSDSEPTVTSFPSGTEGSDEYVYDHAGRMSGVSMTKGSKTLASLAYTRDPAGQVESSVSAGLPGIEEEAFSYDADERLAQAGEATYVYDGASNVIESSAASNAYDDAEELESTTGATFTYDEEGERIEEIPSTGPATAYSYDQVGEVTAVEREGEGENPAIAEAFSYDGIGRIASRVSGAETGNFVWDPTESPALLLTDGEASYIYGPAGLPVEQVSSEEVPIYLHHDQLGSTRLLTDGSGSVVGAFTYDAYGSTAEKVGSATSVLGYAGQYTLGQSGLQYLRARMYDPTTGQFLTKDPLTSRTRDPYGYASENPVNGVDPSGLCDWNPFGSSFWTEGNCLSESPFNPIPYYEAEVDAWESGCDYWTSVLHGLQGASVAAADVTVVGGALEAASRLDEAGPQIDEANAEHIFRDASGHLAEDTVENRILLEDAVKPGNYVFTNPWGVKVYREILPSGEQVWVEVYNGRITNGGVNEVPR